ncbi:hypothetical protein JCM10207_009118 [Rhodosporidiobolus poonsookiae]
MNRGNYDANVLTITELEAAANKKLPKMVRDYYNGGAMDMITYQDNIRAFDKYRIRPRILVDVSKVDMSSEIYGTKVSLPFGFSPSAFQKLAHPIGEIGTSRAAAKANTSMTLSTYSSTAVEDVVREGNGNPYAMQLSMMKSRSANLEIIQRAEACGCKALWMTVDCAILGRRLNEARNSFTLPDDLVLPNLPQDLNWRDVTNDDPRLDYDDACTWESLIPWARSQTKLEIWLKGIYTAEDVQLAISHGVDGIIVSNHGGRQLDTATATIDALPECVAAAAGRIPVHLDSGIRRGTDIFKALALGASFVHLGRAVLWGLGYNGEEGVDLAVGMLRDELFTAMKLAGCATIKDITPAHLAKIGHDGFLSKL